MAIRITAAAVCLALLCACSPISANTEDLLAAPRLNQRQADLEKALSATLNTDHILYKYPQRGDYRSPFVFYDLDGDGVQEAVVFYTYTSETEAVRAKILQEDGQGNWSSLYDLSGDGDQIDFVQFSKLLGGDGDCLVIGWQNTRRGTASLGVYSFTDGRFQPEILQAYQSYTFDNLTGDSLIEIALVAQDERGFYQLLLIGRSAFRNLAVLDSIPLSEDVNSILQLRCGRLWNGSMAVYIDELRTDTAIATEVVEVLSDGMIMCVGESEDFENYRTTFRSEMLLCEDLDGDGVVEIPSVGELPFILESGVIEPPRRVDYLRVTDGSFSIAYSAVHNEDAGYVVFLPEEWVDQVSVVRRPESNEWRFYKVDPGGVLSTELLRIQVYSTRDYRDQFTENDFLLAEKGLFEYYAYIPPTSGEPLAVGEAQVRAMFHLF